MDSPSDTIETGASMPDWGHNETPVTDEIGGIKACPRTKPKPTKRSAERTIDAHKERLPGQVFEQARTYTSQPTTYLNSPPPPLVLQAQETKSTLPQQG